MNIKRAFLVLAAALLLPGLAMAQTTAFTTFVVDFDFDDGNNVDGTTVYISCSGGLPLTSDRAVMDNDVVTFVLEFPEEGAGDTDCDIWVDGVSGYTPVYSASGNSGNTADSTGCHFSNVDDQDENFCDIDMDPLNATLRVYKEWNVIGNSAQANVGTVDFEARIRVCADGNIIQNGFQTGPQGRWCTTGLVYGPSDDYFDVTFTAANFQGNNIYIDERTFDSAIEADITDCVASPSSRPNSGFGGFAYEVFPGDADSCTIVNTVFYEGIPTLNQYGLAIMALLMLGVGFVGFRRFV